MNKNNKSDKKPNEILDNKAKTKRIYKKPQVQSEKLNSYGAVCNGTTVGGRKASSAGPAFCNAARLLS